ncbi:hypothetical protein EDC94DRAFT_529258, partial [Helicostylum pulchrum]
KDFSIEETAHSFILTFLGPGRKSVYTAAAGFNLNEHQIRRCSTKEYCHLTGSTVYTFGLQKKKDFDNITVIESGIPKCKTANSDTFRTYARYIVALFAFYGPRTAKDRFNLYQGRQRAPEVWCF